MIDLFGIHPRQASEGASPASAAPEALPAHSSLGKRLWAVLLVLDTLFLFIFAGALAGMIWLRWSKPVIPPQLAAQRPARKTAPPPEHAKPAPPAAKTTPAPAYKPAPAQAEDKSRLPLGSPSVLAPSLPRREATAASPSSETPQQPREETHVAPAVAGRASKARPVEFVCHAKLAKEVLLKGPFLVRTNGAKAMTKGDGGAWRLTVTLLPGTYKYRCVLDGKKMKVESVIVP